MSDPRYPIGKFQRVPDSSDADRIVLIQQIADAPVQLGAAVAGLSSERLDAPYRSGGWTVRQVVHHLADSHMNAYVRTRLALTESHPTIKPYDERAWAELIDARKAPVESSLILLESLHYRWVMLLRSLLPSDFLRTLQHLEHGVISVDFLLQLYAWHGRHHVSQIKSLRSRMEWD
ncbi:MAG TPA: putative metal-dependent hydrolase [Bacteroidetes bacterium]|jgi:hypothetical protein|nr:putative metal-dependent hydrolase [Bacteroidota bacterium]